jgi:hypothetical protein
MEGSGMGIYGLEGVKSVLLMGLQSSVRFDDVDEMR